MTKPRRIGLFLGLLLLVAALVFTATRSREPQYQGKKLSVWLEEIDLQSSPAQNPPDVQIAIRQMGTNNLPYLLSRLRSRISPLKLQLAEFAMKQNVHRIRFHDNDQDRFAAVVAFQILGPIAKPGIPPLVKMLNESELHYYAVTESLRGIGTDAIPALTNTWSHANPDVRSSGFRSLVLMGTNAESAIPLLILALKDVDIDTRCIAAYSMWSVGRNQPNIAIPALVKTLDDPDAPVQIAAIRALQSFGHKAQQAVPKLTTFLGRRELAGHATFALARIVGTNESLPLVTNELVKQNPVIQGFLIDSLATFQSEAREAIPALIPFARSKNARLRHAAIQALLKIGAEEEVMIPILIQELAATDSMIRGEVLDALVALGPKAKAAVPILLEQIDVLDKNNGQFPGTNNPRMMMMRGFDRYRPHPGSALPNSPPFLEFDVLRKIDPAAADQIKRQLEREKAARVSENSPAP